MISLFLPCLALAADFVVEARVPVDVYVDGHQVAKLVRPSTLRAPVAKGEHEIALYVHGRIVRQDLTFSEEELTVVVGRTGVSWPEAALVAADDPEDPEAVGRVAFRSVGQEVLVVQVARQRHRLLPGDEVSLELGTGDHRLSVRNGEGTVIWSQGRLRVTGDDAIVQIADGRMPEIVGSGVDFTPDGG